MPKVTLDHFGVRMLLPLDGTMYIIGNVPEGYGRWTSDERYYINNSGTTVTRLI